jgi:hypothetical protein
MPATEPTALRDHCMPISPHRNIAERFFCRVVNAHNRTKPVSQMLSANHNLLILKGNQASVQFFPIFETSSRQDGAVE